MREATYQRNLIKKIKTLIPNCIVLKNDPVQNQGIPDLLILGKDRWAMLEVKLSEKAKVQPNQPHHVAKLNDLSFAAFIYPENEERVLNELQSTFRVGRKARISQS